MRQATLQLRWSSGVRSPRQATPRRSIGSASCSSAERACRPASRAPRCGIGSPPTRTTPVPRVRSTACWRRCARERPARGPRRSPTPPLPTLLPLAPRPLAPRHPSHLARRRRNMNRIAIPPMPHPARRRCVRPTSTGPRACLHATARPCCAPTRHHRSPTQPKTLPPPPTRPRPPSSPIGRGSARRMRPASAPTGRTPRPPMRLWMWQSSMRSRRAKARRAKARRLRARPSWPTRRPSIRTRWPPTRPWPRPCPMSIRRSSMMRTWSPRPRRMPSSTKAMRSAISPPWTRTW